MPIQMEINKDLIISDTKTPLGNLLGTVIWENPNKNAIFNPQSITISDLSSYNYFEVYAKNYYTSSYKIISYVKIPMGYDGYLMINDENSGYGSRIVKSYPSQNKIQFTDCKFQTSASADFKIDNGRIVPIYIVGYKDKLF